MGQSCTVSGSMGSSEQRMFCLLLGSCRTWWERLQPVQPIATGSSEPYPCSARMEPLLQGSLRAELTMVAPAGS